MQSLGDCQADVLLPLICQTVLPSVPYTDAPSSTYGSPTRSPAPYFSAYASTTSSLGGPYPSSRSLLDRSGGYSSARAGETDSLRTYADTEFAEKVRTWLA